MRDRLAHGFIGVEAFLPCGIRSLRQCEVHLDQVLRVESQRLVRQLEECFGGRAGPGQQQNSERHLSGDQHAMHLPSVRASRVPRVAGLNELAQLRPGKLPRRRDAEQNTGEQGHRGAEEQDHGIHMDCGLVGKRVQRQPGGNRIHAAVCGEYAQSRSGHGKQNRFGEQLPDQPRPRGADGNAHREFMLPRRSSGKEQDRNIRAANHQQRHHRSEQEHERSRKTPEDFFVQRYDRDAPLHWKIRGIALRETVGEDLQLRRRGRV